MQILTNFAGPIATDPCDFYGVEAFFNLFAGVVLLTVLVYFLAKIAIDKRWTIWRITICTILVYLFIKLLDDTATKAKTCDNTLGGFILVWLTYGSLLYGYLVFNIKTDTVKSKSKKSRLVRNSVKQKKNK